MILRLASCQLQSLRSWAGYAADHLIIPITLIEKPLGFHGALPGRVSFGR